MIFNPKGGTPEGKVTFSLVKSPLPWEVGEDPN